MRTRRAVFSVSVPALVLAAAVGALLAPVVGAGEVPTCNGRPATIWRPADPDVPDEYLGTEGDDVIVASDGADTIFGLGGNDLVCARSGDDYIEGNRGNDTIFGGPGRDTVIGNRGADDLNGNNGNDALAGEEGRDDCDGGAGQDSEFECEVRRSIER